MRFTFGLYANRRAKALLLPALITATAVAFIAMGSLLLTVNPVTQAWLETRADYWVEISGQVTPSDIHAALPELTVDVIPAAVAHLSYPLLGGETALLPVYGLSPEDTEALLAHTGSTTEGVLPQEDGSEPGGMYLPESFLAATNLRVGDEFENANPYQEPFSFLVEGVVTGPIPFGLATLETVASLPIQEPVLLVHSPEMEARQLAEELQAVLAGHGLIRILSPEYFQHLQHERMRTYRLALPMSLVTLLALMTIGLSWASRSQSALLATEQALAKVYYHSLGPSLFRPLAVAALCGGLGWVFGLVLGLAGSVGIGRLWLSSRGLAYTLPWGTIAPSLFLGLAPIFAALYRWSQALTPDLFDFLGQEQQISRAAPDSTDLNHGSNIAPGI